LIKVGPPHSRPESYDVLKLGPKLESKEFGKAPEVIHLGFGLAVMLLEANPAPDNSLKVQRSKTQPQRAKKPQASLIDRYPFVISLQCIVILHAMTRTSVPGCRSAGSLADRQHGQPKGEPPCLSPNSSSCLRRRSHPLRN
jgi:hypothetical protein